MAKKAAKKVAKKKPAKKVAKKKKPAAKKPATKRAPRKRAEPIALKPATDIHSKTVNEMFGEPPVEGDYTVYADEENDGKYPVPEVADADTIEHFADRALPPADTYREAVAPAEFID
jgi:uncharacterized iron-regulated membrane protein